MHLQLEQHDQHSIQSYSDSHITVSHVSYHQPIIISREAIIENWSVPVDGCLSADFLDPLLQLKPELILVGYCTRSILIPEDTMKRLFDRRMGIECMRLGAACRTFNILLNEQRAVVLAVTF
jgi:uncharacterized protein